MSAIAIAANKNASATARPTRPAGATPLSAIAAVGAMIPIEIAIASQKRSSRRRCPRDTSSIATASLAISASLFEDRLRNEASDDPVGGVDHLVDPKVARDTGERVCLLPVEAVALAEPHDRRADRVPRRLHQIRADTGANVIVGLHVCQGRR